MERSPPTEKYAALLADRRMALAQVLAQCVPPEGGIVLEVGSGHGHFLTAYAEKHRDQVCIGVDLDSDRVRRATRKRDRAGLPHLHFIQPEAQVFLDTLAAPVRFHDVYVLFPDPWPKSRHHKHRILQPAFLTRLAPRMLPDARLFFRTDHAAYFADARQAVKEHVAWRLSDEPWAFEYETVFQQRASSYHSFTARARGSA